MERFSKRLAFGTPFYVAMSATAISTIVIFKALGLVLNRQTHIGATGAPPGTKIPLTNHH